jgi:hypothetical protein
MPATLAAIAGNNNDTLLFFVVVIITSHLFRCSSPNNTCATGFTCNLSNSKCTSATCPAGQLPCRCRTNAPRCDGDNVCNNDYCVLPSCKLGEIGCACGSGNTCVDSTLECKAGFCQPIIVECPEGTNDCPCRAGISCDAGLVCNAQAKCELSAVTPTPSPGPTPADGPTPAPSPGSGGTPSPTPVERPTGCVPGSNGCVCLSGGERQCVRGDASCVAGRCVLPEPSCDAGELGCVCDAGQCAAADATCNAALTPPRCEAPDTGREACVDATLDSDHDGIPDCQDDEFTLGQPAKDADGNDIAPPDDGDGRQVITVYDPEQDGKTKIGTVTVPGDGNGQPKTELTGKDANNNDATSSVIRTSGGKTRVPTVDGDGEVEVPFIDITAGGVKRFTGTNAWLMVCLRGALPSGLSIASVCLGALDTSAGSGAQWECVDNHVLPASGVHYCGYTTHLTRFAIIPKSAADALSDADPLSALKAPLAPATDDDSGLPGWALGLIIALAVLCCLLLIVALACFFIRRNDGKSGGSTSRSTRDDDDIAMGEVPRISTYEDRSVNNPAFDRDSGPMTHTTVVEELSDSSLSSSSSSQERVRPGSNNIQIDMDAYQTLRNAEASEEEEEERGNSIIDMNTYKTLSGNQDYGGGDQVSWLNFILFIFL